MVHFISKLTIIPFIKLFIKKVDGQENILKGKPFIVASNHSSYIDDFVVPSILMPILNKEIHFYVNSSYFNNYFSRKFLEWYGNIPIDTVKGKNYKQVNKKAFQIALKYLGKNDIVAIFPEGTRSIDGRLCKGKTGIARLALKSKVPVLPIGIIGSYKILPKGKFLPRFRRCNINIGKPLYFKEYYNKNINDRILERTTRKIMKEIAKLTNQEYNH